MTSGEFAEVQDAIELPQLVAAANWHALATWAGRAVPVGPALLIDAGSTTTDIIPLLNGIPCPQGFTDLQRLADPELVYTGVRRTPILLIVHHVPLLDESQTNNPDAADTLPVPVARNVCNVTGCAFNQPGYC